MCAYARYARALRTCVRHTCVRVRTHSVCWASLGLGLVFCWHCFFHGRDWQKFTKFREIPRSGVKTIELSLGTSLFWRPLTPRKFIISSNFVQTGSVEKKLFSEKKNSRLVQEIGLFYQSGVLVRRFLSQNQTQTSNDLHTNVFLKPSKFPISHFTLLWKNSSFLTFSFCYQYK